MVYSGVWKPRGPPLDQDLRVGPRREDLPGGASDRAFQSPTERIASGLTL